VARTLQCVDSNSLAFVILSEAKDLPFAGWEALRIPTKAGVVLGCCQTSWILSEVGDEPTRCKRSDRRRHRYSTLNRRERELNGPPAHPRNSGCRLGCVNRQMSDIHRRHFFGTMLFIPKCRLPFREHYGASWRAHPLSPISGALKVCKRHRSSNGRAGSVGS
jgi:hypothetical protein